MKRCNKCGKTKPLNEYHKSKNRYDGVCVYCKTCTSEYSKIHSRKPEIKKKNKENAKIYRQLPYVKEASRKAVKIYSRSKKGKRKRKEYNKEYLKRDGVQVGRRDALTRWRSKPESKIKLKAHGKVSAAVEGNKIPHPTTLPCDDCNEQADHYHHWSYEEQHWLDVIPLCASCHGIRHRATETA